MSNFREENDLGYWDDVRDSFKRKGKYTQRQSSVLKQLQRQAGPAGQRLSTEWWKSKVKELGDVDGKGLYLAEKKNHRKNVMVGKMYMYFYDPKHKKKLPYYDKLPLCFIFNRDSKYLWGINFHYLPIKHRIALLDKFMLLATDNRFDARTKTAISWQILKNTAKYPEVRPCVKQYIRGNVRSQFMLVQPNDWLTATLLPVESFSKASRKTVWADSKVAIKNAKNSDKKKRKKK